MHQQVAVIEISLKNYKLEFAAESIQNISRRCGLLVSFGAVDLAHHCFSRHQAITWTDVHLSSVKSGTTWG